MHEEKSLHGFRKIGKNYTLDVSLQDEDTIEITIYRNKLAPNENTSGTIRTGHVYTLLKCWETSQLGFFEPL